MTRKEAERLLVGAHTVRCRCGRSGVTWESPAPTVGSAWQCDSWFGCAAPGVVESVKAGLPLQAVRECLGREAAAHVLALGGVSLP